ncbi:MAG: precorrin-3B C(17)-methyltransferase, partial [bacterium]
GKDVALVSSGDAGIYGMGAALFEVLEQRDWTEAEVNVSPGITALNATSALLGAPAGQDFASVSLSDLLTPWETIRDRVSHALKGDFVLAIYNPKSKDRHHQLPEVLEMAREYRSDDTPVGIVHQGYRDGQSVDTVSLSDVPVETIDMLTTVIIGNSMTRTFGDWMYTPRGYTTEVTPA